MKKVIALCGSQSSRSVNLQLISEIKRLADKKFNLELFEGLDRLPHFNPDLDRDVPPAEISAFRIKLQEADGVLICTPEYAMGVPGTMKNALDWLVSSMELAKKPVALITASTSGEKAHASLTGTLNILEAAITSETQLLIPFIKTKIDAVGRILDEKVLANILTLIDGLANTMQSGDADQL
jgi:NAD(P)H-dependent FMN reductase